MAFTRFGAAGQPRPGQWLKFKLAKFEHPEAHRTADGLLVGIYHQGGVDAFGQPSNPAIFLVDRTGHNIVAVVKDPDGNMSIVNLWGSIAPVRKPTPGYIGEVLGAVGCKLVDLPPEYGGNRKIACPNCRGAKTVPGQVDPANPEVAVPPVVCLWCEGRGVELAP